MPEGTWDNDFPIQDERVKFPAPILNFDKIPAPPQGIFDAPSVYVCLNSGWASIVIERLRVLTRKIAWQGDETEQVRASQEMEKLLAMFGCEDCSEFITDIRVDPITGQMQTKKGGAWGNANGDGGDTTVINNQENLLQETYPPAPVDGGLTAEERACNIASGLTGWFFDRAGDALDTVEAIADSIGAADAIFGIFPPLYLIVDVTYDMVNEFLEAGVNLIRASDTQGQRETTICAIYSFLVETGSVDDSNVAGLRDAIHDSLSGNSEFLAWWAYLLAFTDSGLVHRSMLYQSVGGSVNCGLLCGLTGCSTFSASGVENWTILQGTFVASGCTNAPGVKNTPPGAFEIKFTLPAGVTLSSIRYRDSHGAATIDALLGYYNGSTLISTIAAFQGGVGANSCFDTIWNLALTGGDNIKLYVSADANYEFSSITVCWSGA